MQTKSSQPKTRGIEGGGGDLAAGSAAVPGGILPATPAGAAPQRRAMQTHFLDWPSGEAMDSPTSWFTSQGTTQARFFGLRCR